MPTRAAHPVKEVLQPNKSQLCNYFGVEALEGPGTARYGQRIVAAAEGCLVLVVKSEDIFRYVHK